MKKQARKCKISRQPRGYYRSASECEYEIRNLKNWHVITFCPLEFHKYTTLRLEPGEEAIVRINIEVLES